jgi:predicted ATPase
VMLLSGEPGIGKSRIVQALREQVGADRPAVLNHYCSPYHLNSALYPVIAQLERAAGMERSDPSSTRLDRLEVLLAPLVAGDHEAVPLIAALLSIPTGGRYPPLALSPQRQMQRTMEVLVACLAGAARDSPVLVLYEDVHWIDPTTQTLLGLLVERVAHLPALMVMTFRPEFTPPWTGHAHVTSLLLSRLARRQGTTMVEELAGAKPLPAEVVEQIVTRTDGVPLFVEELTKTVLESGLLRDAGDHWELDGPFPALAIPSTLQDSLMARLDRLPPVKEVAQIGAAIGRVFSHQLLAAVSPLDEAQLQAALDRLVEAELVFRQGSSPATSYTFKHALVQDAAYQSLLKSRRVDLHGRITTALERDFPQVVEAQPELLAHHQTEAGLVTQAIDSWLRAGEHAQARSAHLEAIAHLQRGLALVAEVPGAAEQARHELDFHAALGISLLATKGFAASEVGQSYVKAEALSEQTGVTARLYAILQGLWFHHTVRCELERAFELAQRLYRMASDDGDPAHLLAAHHTLCHAHFWFGSFEDSRTSLDEALHLADRAEQESLTTLIGADLAVFARAFGAHTMWHLGFAGQASRLSDHAVALARERQDPFTLGLALDYAAMFRQFARERNAAQALAAEAVELCRTRHFAYYLAWARMIYGWSLAGDGRVDDSLHELRAGLDDFEATGAGLRRSYYWSLLAEVEARAGRSGDGLGLLDDAIALVERTGERWHEAELHRLKGQLVLQTRPNRDEAETCFQRALAIARRQAARAPELQAALDLARLWAEGGKRQKALDLLAPVYDRFTEGFDTSDLIEAKALLDELA